MRLKDRTRHRAAFSPRSSRVVVGRIFKVNAAPVGVSQSRRMSGGGQPQKAGSVVSRFKPPKLLDGSPPGRFIALPEPFDIALGGRPLQTTRAANSLRTNPRF
jgi:hypothetical protein